jgi:hypothetical protein
MTELNRDIYKEVASKMFGIPYEEVTDDQRVAAKRQLLDYLYDRRLEPLNGIESGTSEEPYMLKATAIKKMIEQGNVTPLKDLHRRFISDCKNKGYKVTEFQDEITMDVPLR